MRATLGIKWLIVLLGFLCHSIYLNTAAESVTTKPAINNGNIATDTVTTVSLKGVSNSTSQNSITTQSTKLQTPKSPQTILTTTKNTPTGAIPTEKSSTASMTSSSSTATQTAFIPMAVSSSTLAITSMTTTARTAAIPSNGPMQPFQPDATMIPAYSGSTETAATSAPTSVSEAQQSSTSSTSSTTAQTSKAPTLTTVTMKQLSPRDTNKIPESTTVHGRAIANTHPNPGVSSTSSSISSSTSSSTSSRTSFSVNKGVNTATTDSATQVTTVPTSTRTLTSTQLQKFVYSHKGNVETKEKDDKKNLRKVCKRLMESIENGTCTLNWLIQNGSVKIESVEINGKVNESLAQQYYDELTKKELIKTDNKTLIAILASCGALLIMIVILGACASHHRKPYNENQQHLTEELHTVENGYHDNPTLEVMEVQPEMLEKKMVLNGEFNDSWMVPLDHLSKEDHPEEEDTHL